MKRLLILCSLSIALFSSCTTRIVSTAPSSEVVIVEKLPKHHRVIVKKGTKYYYWNGKYHKKYRHGYVVVKYRGM